MERGGQWLRRWTPKQRPPPPPGCDFASDRSPFQGDGSTSPPPYFVLLYLVLSVAFMGFHFSLPMLPTHLPSCIVGPLFYTLFWVAFTCLYFPTSSFTFIRSPSCSPLSTLTKEPILQLPVPPGAFTAPVRSCPVSLTSQKISEARSCKQNVSVSRSGQNFKGGTPCFQHILEPSWGHQAYQSHVIAIPTSDTYAFDITSLRWGQNGWWWCQGHRWGALFSL